MSGYSAAPLPSSPILNTLNISVAMLFSGSLSFFTHLKPGLPFRPRPSQDVGPSSRTLGTLSPVSLPPSPGPPSPGERPLFVLALALLPATSGTLRS